MADYNQQTTTTTTTVPQGYSQGYAAPTTSGTAYANNNTRNTRGRKYKPYRNRPSKAQALLEILSFLLLLASVPAFLGGTLSIFVFYFALILGFMGLFAWTRRHSVMLSLLAFALIILAIVNIVLRSQNQANCMPYFYYRNLFAAAAVGGNTVNTTQPVNNTAPVVPVVPVPVNTTQPLNNTLPAGPVVPVIPPIGGGSNSTNDTARTLRYKDSQNGNNNGNNGNGFGNLINGGNNGFDNDDDDGDYDNSIWCGGRKIVYITHAIIIALAIPILILALSLLRQRRRSSVPAVQQTQSTTTVKRSVVEA